MSVDDFYRIRRLPPYLFAEVNQMKAQARAAGEDIIDLGMGNPDLPTPSHIVEKLKATIDDPHTHRYSMSRGITGLRKAQAAYYQRRFGVSIDPESETIVTLGSKEGLANLAQAITAPGDVMLVPNPSYPIHPYGFMIAGASVRHIPIESVQANRPRFADRNRGKIKEGSAFPESAFAQPTPQAGALEQGFMTSLAAAVQHSVPSPTALIVNFPGNPTTDVVSLDFYQEVVDFCKKRGIWILSDLAYAEIYFDDMPPPSILQTRGGKDIAIEFTSASKTYSMAGWRIGFATGNRRLISALTRVKSYLDYGAFTPIQVAATAALNGPQTCVAEARAVYKERRDILIDGLAAAGWQVPSPRATMFAWAPLPSAFAHLGSMAFSKRLLQEAKVAVAPGIGFGEYGEGYVRIALVENKERLRQAIRGIKRFMARADKQG